MNERKPKFQLGQKVSMLNDTITGTVVKIDLNNIMIRSEDGFDYKCDENELIAMGNLDLFLKNDHQSKFYKEKLQTSNTKTTRFKSSKRKQNQLLEVDLHIHHLIDTAKGLSNHDILSFQLKTAKQQLEYAIHKKIPNVIFIHGVGEGILKQKLKYLFRKYPVEVYEASFQKYGRGATEVRVY